MSDSKILLLNPRSARHGHRLPVSILQIAASIHGKFDYAIVDGNLESEGLKKVLSCFQNNQFKILAVTVMPGPQLREAVIITREIKRRFPDVITIWGGYFPSLHPDPCMNSGFVDYVVRGPGDIAFPLLADFLLSGKGTPEDIPNLVFKDGGQIRFNPIPAIPDQASLPALPYDDLEKFYPLKNYLIRTFLGQKTIMYHSGIGCPHECAFCGVANVYHSMWKGKPAGKMSAEILSLNKKYGVDSLEIIDSNFFSSKERVIDFCRIMKGRNIQWWAEGRIDALDRYTGSELSDLREAGCRLIFMGAESGSNDLLEHMNKGGKMKAETTLKLVERFHKAGIIPELSFVLGLPGKNPEEVSHQINREISFIRKIRKINTETQLVLYLYSPVPTYGSGLFDDSASLGFVFPATLEDWISPEWEQFSIRQGMITPWLTGSTVRRIRNFETVLSAAFPDISNFHVPAWGKKILKLAGSARYNLGFYHYPLEIKSLLRLFSYRNPGKEGFYSE